MIMRHFSKITLLLLFMFGALPTPAQFRFGVTGGLNISQFHVSDNTYKGYVNRTRPGFLVGPTVIYTIPKTGLGFDLSALYDLRGVKSKSIKDSEAISYKSFQVPLNIRLGMDFGDILYGFVFAGPQLGINLGSKESLIAVGTGKTTGHDLARHWVNQGTAFSCNFGVGGIVLEKVQIRVSYNLALRKTGFIEQIDLVDGSTKTLTDGKANACQIALSYLF